MPNGKPGDHPYTDIVVHKQDIYSKRVSDLIREIASLSDESGRTSLAGLLWREYDESGGADVAQMERVLTEMRDNLLANGNRPSSEP